MSIFLSCLGDFAYRRHWLVIVVWLLLLGGLTTAILAGNGIKIRTNVTIDGTESQSVLDELRQEMPEAAGGQGIVVFKVKTGETLLKGAPAEALNKAAVSVAELPYVVDLSDRAEAAAADARMPAPGEQVDPKLLMKYLNSPRPLIIDGEFSPGLMISKFGDTAMLQIQFTKQIEDLPEGTLDEVMGLIDKATAHTGIETLKTTSMNPLASPVNGLETFGLAIAALVLIITLGSLRAAGLPLLNALAGVGAGVGGALALSHRITMTSATPVLALMIGMAVGIDYAMFIVNRHRQFILADGLTARDAAARAVGTAGSAVVFAGLTVIIALSGLALIGIPFLATLAIVAAVTVALTVLSALTLIPALLGLIGEKIVTQKAREKRANATLHESHRVANQWVSTVVRHPWTVTIGIIAVLALITIPMFSLKLGMPNGSTANLNTQEAQAYYSISEGFGEGYNAPLVVVARGGKAGLDAQATKDISNTLNEIKGVASALLVGESADSNTAIYQVTPQDGPDDSATADLVHRLRSDGASIVGQPDTSVGVTGLTAINLDISEKLGSVLPVYVGIVVGLSVLTLLIVLRSILIPLKATIGFLSSLGATLGMVTLIFQWGWFQTWFGFDMAGPIISFLPIMLTGILYGLAMDYELFLVSSMKEAHVHGKQGIDAIVSGFLHSSRVVTAAATIMISVFAGFIFASDVTIKQFGIALTLGVFIDAFLIRMAFGPAVMALLGNSAWWLPKWLDRLLPNLDIEGDALVRKAAEEAEKSPQLA
jgi:RND superfamily putative drug exporter